MVSTRRTTAKQITARQLASTAATRPTPVRDHALRDHALAPQPMGLFAKLSPELRNMIYELVATREARHKVSYNFPIRVATSKFGASSKIIAEEYRSVLLSHLLTQRRPRSVYYVVEDLDFGPLIERYLTRLPPRIKYRTLDIKLSFTEALFDTLTLEELETRVERWLVYRSEVIRQSSFIKIAMKLRIFHEDHRLTARVFPALQLMFAAEYEDLRNQDGGTVARCFPALRYMKQDARGGRLTWGA